MTTPRVAAIHDMSGFGRCSLTVAIPILSAMGLLSAHYPQTALRIMKKELAYHGYSE